MRFWKKKPHGVNNILDRLPEITRKANQPHEKVNFSPVTARDGKPIKVIDGREYEIQERPDKELLITEISGKERIINAKDIRGMDSLETKAGYQYYIKVLEESIEISWPEFKRLTFYANGDRYLLNR